MINAIITVIWGLAGFVMIPDTPQKANPWAFWFKKEDSENASRRLARENRMEMKPITWAAAKYDFFLRFIRSSMLTACRRTFRNWPVYMVAVMYISMVLGTSGWSYFNLFLKAMTNSDGSARWSTEEINLIPIGGSVITVAFGKSADQSSRASLAQTDIRSMDLGIPVRHLEDKMGVGSHARYILPFYCCRSLI